MKHFKVLVRFDSPQLKWYMESTTKIRKLRKNLKKRWKYSLVLILPSRKTTLGLVVKNYIKITDIRVSRIVQFCLISWHCFIKSPATVVCCELKILYRSPCKLNNLLRFKHALHKKLVSYLVCRYRCGFCRGTYYGKTCCHFFKRAAEYLGVLNVTEKRVKNAKPPAAFNPFLSATANYF